MLSEGYTVNEYILNRAIKPVIKVDDVIRNIQVEEQRFYGEYPTYQKGWNTSQ